MVEKKMPRKSHTVFEKLFSDSVLAGTLLHRQEVPAKHELCIFTQGHFLKKSYAVATTSSRLRFYCQTQL